MLGHSFKQAPLYHKSGVIQNIFHSKNPAGRVGNVTSGVLTTDSVTATVVPVVTTASVVATVSVAITSVVGVVSVVVY